MSVSFNVRLDFSMETILDPGWRFIFESLHRGMFYAGSDAPANPAEMKQWVTKLERPDVAPPAPGLQDKASSWKNVEAPLPSPSPRGQVTFTHQLPTCSCAGTSETTVPTGDILSGYEDDVTSGNDLSTSWARIKPEAILALHMVVAHRAAAEYREASERKPGTSSLVHHGQMCSQPFD